ncbi:MAG: hypothetical protein ABWZ42_02150 [Ilumatobacteraceae bacterium]
MACDLDLPSVQTVECVPVMRRVVQFCEHRVHTAHPRLELRRAHVVDVGREQPLHASRIAMVLTQDELRHGRLVELAVVLRPPLE